MKKTLFTLVAATAMILGLTGCDALMGNKGSDTDSESWGGQKSEKTDSAKEQYTATMTFSEGFTPATDWCVWTDVKGLVLSEQPEMEVAEDKKSIKWTFNQDILDLGDYNNSPSSENFVLYIHIDGTDKKAGDLKENKKDVRGRICIYADRKVTFESKNYKEVLNEVGIVTITNNEPTEKSSYKNGNYTITEIWPLAPKADDADTDTTKVNAVAGGKYEINDGMKLKELKVGLNETISFPIPAGTRIIGLYQPNRKQPLDKTVNDGKVTYAGKSGSEIKTETIKVVTSEGTVEKTRAELLGIKTEGKTDDEIEEAYKKVNIKLIFAEEITIPAHNTLAESIKAGTKSYDYQKYWFTKSATGSITRNKSASDVEIVEVTAAPIEK